MCIVDIIIIVSKNNVKKSKKYEKREFGKIRRKAHGEK